MSEDAKPNLPVGISEVWYPGEYARVDSVLADMDRLGIERLHLAVAEKWWQRAEGRHWYDWLFDRVGTDIDVTPSLQAAGAGETTDVGFERFAQAFLDRFGDRFRWYELDCASRFLFYEQPAPACMLAARRLHDSGKHVAMAVRVPFAFRDTRLLDEDELLDSIDAVGLQAPNRRLDEKWPGWAAVIDRVRELLAFRGRRDMPIWITATGIEGGRHRTREELTALREALDAPAERVYWHGTRDHADPSTMPPVIGLCDSEGRQGLGLRLISRGGRPALDAVLDRPARLVPGTADEPVALITGGAGFIGANVADHLLHNGWRTIILDNLARPGTEINLEWLRRNHPNGVSFELGDVCDKATVDRAARQADRVYHFAAQVAVTTSLDAPSADFDVNAAGTLQLLEALRRRDAPPPLLFTSTNKVYGGLADIVLEQVNDHYLPADPVIRASGIGEDRPLSFCSPYGCSKGCAEQYVLDYSRTFGLPNTVFRMSCVYGPRQFGNEDQGWIAHFLISALNGSPVTIYGDGRQVRDVLYIDDLIAAMDAAFDNPEAIRGKAFNIGGGPDNTLSLTQLLAMIEAMHGTAPPVSYRPWRASDQRYYVSDISGFGEATGWRPRVGVGQGVRRLERWLAAYHVEDSNPVRIAL